MIKYFKVFFKNYGTNSIFCVVDTQKEYMEKQDSIPETGGVIVFECEYEETKLWNHCCNFKTIDDFIKELNKDDVLCEEIDEKEVWIKCDN